MAGDSSQAQQTRARGSETLFAKKQRKFHRSSNVEVLISHVVHFGILCFCVYVKVFESGVIRRLADEGNLSKGFPGILSFGGRWKFLTYINFVSTILHFDYKYYSARHVAIWLVSASPLTIDTPCNTVWSVCPSTYGLVGLHQTVYCTPQVLMF